MRELHNLTKSLEELIITEDLGRRGVIYFLAESLKRKIEDPLGNALRLLADTSSLMIVTGFNIPPDYRPETDGIIGAAVFARAFVNIGSNEVVIVLDNEEQKMIMEHLIRILLNENTTAEKITFLTRIGNEYLFREILVEEISSRDIGLGIFIEKPSPNREGVMHNMRGIDVSQQHLDPRILLDVFREMGVKTIGIGDGGNEVGLGIIEEDVRKYVPYGNICACPCRSGIASSTITDTAIVSTVSNWGAYALEALLLAINDKSKYIHSGKEEIMLIEESLRKGAIDGVRGKDFVGVDGIPPNYHAKIVDAIKAITLSLL